MKRSMTMNWGSVQKLKRSIRAQSYPGALYQRFDILLVILWVKLRRWLAVLAQLGKQCLGLLQVGGVKAFGEPTIDFGQQRSGFCLSALSLP